MCAGFPQPGWYAVEALAGLADEAVELGLVEIDAAAERVHTLSTKVQLWLEKHSRLLAELKVGICLGSMMPCWLRAWSWRLSSEMYDKVPVGSL